jgi:hypothetical protein
MSNKKQTAMQDLRQDLLDTIVTGSDALNEIEDEQLRNGAINLFETTINTIISRIDEELLEMEKHNIIDAYISGRDNVINRNNILPLQYYNENYEI